MTVFMVLPLCYRKYFFGEWGKNCSAEYFDSKLIWKWNYWLLIVREKKRSLTAQDGQDSAGASKLAFGFVGGWANLDALESEHGDYHGSEPKQQRNDHQGTTCLYVTCKVTDSQTGSDLITLPALSVATHLNWCRLWLVLFSQTDIKMM